VDLTSYAELAVRLVNTAVRADEEPDPLGSSEAFRRLVADRPFLAGPVTGYDLDTLRLLREELGQVFHDAADGSQESEELITGRLNALLIRHPVQPVIVSHASAGQGSAGRGSAGQGGGRWHIHLSETGCVADRYAAGAVIGLTLLLTQIGMKRLGVCAIVACPGVFIDSSTNHSRRYCPEHARTNVTAIRAQGRAGGSGRLASVAS
jgi:Putative stress-induced transcription regulator/CGNR zinc finger